MNSSLFTNIFIGIVLALVSYFLLPVLTSDLSANLAIAIGILIGSLAASLSLLISASDTDNEEVDENGSLTTLYVGNLPYRANEQAVKQHFQTCGNVASVRLMKDKRTGKRKGYGFVEIASNAADKAISELNDSEFQDRTLKVRLAKEKTLD